MAESHATVTRDPDAQSDFRKRHGVLNPDIPIGNAEALQLAHRASQSRAVQKASLLPINNQATADLDLADLSGQLDGDEVHAAAVRGNAIVVVAEDANGRAYKTVLPANDNYVAPKEDAADVASSEAAKAELAFQGEIAKLRSEYESELAKLRDEMLQTLSEEIGKAREGTLDKASENATAAAEAQEDDADKKEPAVEVPAENDPSQGGGAKTEKSVPPKGRTKK